MARKKMLLSVDETATEVGIGAEVLNEWINQGVIAPNAMSTETGPLFDPSDLESVTRVKGLFELGYEAGEILKIARKVGLPRGGKNNSKKKISRYLTVGELAEKTGLNNRTIKHWEEKGLIKPTTRSAGGFRLYDESVVETCAAIADLQLLGYTLTEIRRLVDLIDVDAVIEKAVSAEEPIDELVASMELLTGEVSEKMQQLAAAAERQRKRLKETRSRLASARKKLPRPTTASAENEKTD